MAGSGAPGVVTVQLPRVLGELTGCHRTLEVSGATVAEVIAELVRRHPALALHLFDDSGTLRRHVLCFRNDIAIHARATLDEPLVAGDRLALVSSVAGG